MGSDYDRAFDFQRKVLARTSTRSEALPWGTAFFQDEFPLRYDANMAIVESGLGGATADDVVAVLDDAYAGFRHRGIELGSAAEADAIAMGMVEHGYAFERMVVMALRREPDREPDLTATEELDHDGYRPLSIEINSREPWCREAGAAEYAAEFRKVLAEDIGARFFAQRVDGRLAGSCELYVMDDTAQIEDVNTLEEFRGRGVARNVVLRAAAEARKAGATFVFLSADVDDWPRVLYGRLGFDEVGRTGLFARRPEREDGGSKEATS